MLRSSLVASAVAVLCAAASAQQSDLSRVLPITAPVKHAGVYNLATGKFQRATPGQKAVVQNIYNNTCQFGNWYQGDVECEDLYDEGRVPNGGVGADHNVSLIEIAYCVATTTGNVDIDIELYNTSNGDACTFGSAGAPPPFTAGIAGFDSSSAGFPLPGSTGVGLLGCWIVGFSTTPGTVCLNSGATSADLFKFRASMNNSLAQQGGVYAGTLLCGNPGASPVGGGTFSNPFGTDPVSGLPCGHGLDSQDSEWINVDNSPIVSTAPTCPGAVPYGTACYWFGGYPTNPFAGMWLRMEGDGSCSCTGNVATYCTAKVNSLGCTPAVSFSGAPTVANCGTQTFNLTASNLVGNKNGLWFYSTTGPLGAPFHGGHLCVKSPTKRLAVQNTGGAGTACNGSMTTNFNARICSGSDTALTAGANVWAQSWSRDPASPSTDNLTNALSFNICN